MTRRLAFRGIAAIAVAAGLACAPQAAPAQAVPRNAPRRSHAPWTRAVGKDTTRLAWRGLDYGSDAYFSPVTAILNRGYDIFQVRNSLRNFWSFSYRETWEHDVKAVLNGAFPSVARFGGWSRFARVELLPISWKYGDMNWAPNYIEHFLGGGITMRMLDEWYRDKGVPLPRLWAILTTYAGSILNEMTEHPGATAATAGTFADLLVFDVAAVTLFHWDQPTRFLMQTLQVADWSSQATFTFPNRELQNNGQYMTAKVPIGFERTRAFVRIGLSGQAGVSQKLDEEHHLSVGLGWDTKSHFVDTKSGHETVRFAPAGGVYYDRDNSLLWSATLTPAENTVAVNVYPGVLPGIARDVGAWVVYTSRGQLTFGVVHRRALGLGLGLGW